MINRRIRTLIISFGVACLLIFLLSRGNGNLDDVGRNVLPPHATQQTPKPGEVEMVVASMSKDDVSWLAKYLPGMHTNIYVADDPKAALTVPKNKGHEAMVYLTYIIDNYDKLADITIFIHASRFAWHNDDPDYDALPTLRNLQLSYVKESGYVNLRCVWVIGCPAEIRPYEDEGQETTPDQPNAKAVYKSAFRELMPGVPVPEVVAVSCCSQFALTKETIRRHPKEKYILIRDWLLETQHPDEISGRVMEFSWHILFGKQALHCPSAKECYCKVWGMCNLDCNDERCEGRYTLPGRANLPEGWPTIGWEGEARPFPGPLD